MWVTGARTSVSLLLTAEPVHLAMTLSMHFLWMAALHSEGTKTRPELKSGGRTPGGGNGYSRLHW